MPANRRNGTPASRLRVALCIESVITVVVIHPSIVIVHQTASSKLTAATTVAPLLHHYRIIMAAGHRAGVELFSTTC
jgi:hypothetical protein